MTELFETVRYSPTLPEGTVVDEHGLPVIDDDDEDEGDDENEDGVVASAVEERAAAALAALDDDASEDDLAALAALAADDGLSEEAFLSRMPPQLRESYLRGKVAARIRWGTPGDFTRCVAQAKIHGMGRKAEGACARLHRDAVGFWPGDRRNR